MRAPFGSHGIDDAGVRAELPISRVMSDKNKSSSQSAEDRAASAQTRAEDADLMARGASNDQQAIAELYDRFVAGSGA